MTRLSSMFDRLKPHPVAPWVGGLPDRTTSEVALLQGILERWQRYQTSEIDRTVSPEDDMMVHGSAENEQHYLRVGVSAVELITEAMLLSRRLQLPRVLDFPCGGGRVTRHLVRFLPDSEISVSDIERKKQAFVVAQFGAKAVECPPDFSVPPPEHYDLIFVGSLFSHLDDGLFRRALNFFIDALAPGGLLVLTTHGRYSATAVSAGRTRPRDPIRRMVDGSFARSGFGYVEQEPTRYGVSYGAAFSTPSWVVRLIEPRADAMILGYKERAWDNHQDALMVQKLP